MTAKLALGTVQFGLRYGVANQSGQITQSEAGAILHHASVVGIDTLDTAIAYGDSEACLGRIGVSSWRVITKLPPLPVNVLKVKDWVREQIDESLLRLRVEVLEAVMLHRSSDLLTGCGDAYKEVLEDLKASGKTRSVGVSIYDPAELDALWDVWRPDIVQAPLNIMDRRLLHSGWLDKLQRHNVRVHTRSVFLQGLLLMSAANRPRWFAPWDGILNGWLAWCQHQNLSSLQAALGFALSKEQIECVVVGVDGVAQLEEILAASASTSPIPPEDMFSVDCDLIDPSRWKLL